MSNIKINELDAITSVASDNVLPIVDSNEETKKVSVLQLKTKITEDLSNLHFVIVQTLPTQDIQTNVIYLVPKVDSGIYDVYDEYVYINNNWEKIGDTSIDLSNYYTKTEVDNLIDENTSSIPIYSFKITGINSLSSVGNRYNFNTNEKNDLINIINDAYSKNYNTFFLYLYFANGYETLLLEKTQFDLSGNLKSKPTSIMLVNTTLVDETLSGQLPKVRKATMNLSLSWSGNTCSISGLTYMNVFYVGVLSSSNTQSYTPTGDYNPATKKYVDDSISTTLGTIETTLGGI